MSDSGVPRLESPILTDANLDLICVVLDSDTEKGYDRSMTCHLLNPIRVLGIVYCFLLKETFLLYLLHGVYFHSNTVP